MNTLILHGWGGSDASHWQSYLACRLAQDYGTVSFPSLLDKDLPKKDIWVKQVTDGFLRFKADVVVCHSLGCTLWLHLCLEQKAQRVKKLILVAPPSLTCNIPELASFFPLTLPSDVYAKEVILITSTNDIYMTTDEADDMAKALGARHIVLKDAGHINADSGYGNWDEIVDLVKESRI